MQEVMRFGKNFSRACRGWLSSRLL